MGFTELNLFGVTRDASGKDRTLVGRVTIPLPLNWKRNKLGWYKIVFVDTKDNAEVCGEVKLEVDVEEVGKDDSDANQKRYQDDTRALVKSVSMKGFGRKLFGKRKDSKPEKKK